MKQSVFSRAEWIWSKEVFDENEYAEFLDRMIWNGGNRKIRISVCGDYTLFINGRYAAGNQYGDFEHYKVYDEIDITDFLKEGENIIGILVWYFGTSGMRYFTPKPGLIYEVLGDECVVTYSRKSTLSRKSRAYVSGLRKIISPQLGYSFSYDMTKEDNWKREEAEGFGSSVVIQPKLNFYMRPVKKLDIGSFRKGSIIETQKTEDKYLYRIDLGEEVVGLPFISFDSDKEQNVLVAYGELLKYGRIKRIINDRDFSFEYRAKRGENIYINYMFRLACRYIEIESDYPLVLHDVGVLPQNYTPKDKIMVLTDFLDQQIYDICVNTLKLCMMEHYVDCPWREQCLYAYDARNQMLAGYYAFADGNYEYARANLLLMSKDARKDGLLSICFPSGENLTIPAFSLYYILAVKEYLHYSGDLSLGREVFDKIGCILDTFVRNMKSGLVCRFEGSQYWNFYDWSLYADSQIGKVQRGPDLMLNCIMVIALNAYKEICGMLSEKNIYGGLAEEIVKKSKEQYYNAKTGLFFIERPEEEPTELVNSLAIIAGVVEGESAEAICEVLSSGGLESCSLSMKPFKYDALIMVNMNKYKNCILAEIRQNYKSMLDAGSTTVWEVLQGGDTWGNAGSLCHGWSAMPVYYYHLFKEE